MSYVYIENAQSPYPSIWTVGYYNEEGFQPESDHGSAAEAAARVHYLNGGGGASLKILASHIEKLSERIAALEEPK